MGDCRVTVYENPAGTFSLREKKKATQAIPPAQKTVTQMPLSQPPEQQD